MLQRVQAVFDGHFEAVDKVAFPEHLGRCVLSEFELENRDLLFGHELDGELFGPFFDNFLDSVDPDFARNARDRVGFFRPPLRLDLRLCLTLVKEQVFPVSVDKFRGAISDHDDVGEELAL